MHSQSWSALMSDPTGESLGIGLPPGSLIDHTQEGPWPQPALWSADDIADSAPWPQGLPSDLRPVLFQDGEEQGQWWKFALDPVTASDPNGHDAATVLASLWADAVSESDDEDDEDDTLAPFDSEWPGLAPGRATDIDPDARAAEVAADMFALGLLPSPRLVLVPVSRSADAPAAIGWTGPAGYEPTVLRAVLRSWEDRFGARLVALSADRMDLSVASPPRTTAEALAVAAEHFAFCPDNIWQGYDTMSAYAEEALIGKVHWTFWWD